MSSVDVVKRKRGRPRISDNEASTKQKATKKLTDEVVTEKKTKSRARQGQVPMLNIASYGKNSAIGTLAAQTEQRKHENKLMEMTISSNDPIILTLPISDELEKSLTNAKQLTLDAQYTEYSPQLNHNIDVAPYSDPSKVRGAAYTGSSVYMTLQRCVVCAPLPGACDTCIDAFNKSVSVTMESYKDNREKFTPPRETLLSGQEHEFVEVSLPSVSSVPLVPLVGNKMEVIVEEPRTKTQPQMVLTCKKKERPQNVDSESLECMWHLLPFDSAPVGLPLSYNESTRKFESIGHFCSLECAYAYRLEHRSAEAASIQLLHQAHSMNNPNNTKLTPAPPRQALIRFGGTMTYEEFLKPANSWFVINRPPFIFVTEEVKRTNEQGMYRSLSGQKGGTTELVRKRDKPHPNSANQWHSSIERAKGTK